MQTPICKPKPQSHLEFLKPLLDDSIKQLLLQYRSGRTNFSDFDSIFTRILHDLHGNPPLELVWFYSAVRFYSSRLAFRDDSVRLTSSFFQLLVSFSDSFSGVKKGPEDEALLTEIITDDVIKSAEKLFLNPGSGTSQRSLHLKNIAINWLFLFVKALASLRRNKDQEKTISYIRTFSNSHIPHHLINWVISQGEVIRDADALRNLTPASFIEWLVTLEEQGLRVFDCDHSKKYAKTVIHMSRPDLSLGATLQKQQEEFDQDADMADGNTVSSISILSSNTRKRKEERHNEGETKVKLFKHRHSNIQEKSKCQPFVFSDSLVNGTEVEVSDMEL
ncbi:PREDICTED: uncharacterized protein LOC104705445 [Camelina sativa]|uniref:Uncharacterized protein LOC104705445 n=1 Tax=Camelina sativa TaxID=90675 RepID=A0ABM1QD91_CAMSA|nr:PREDICTED: uncharacterized protein LOC104705445 [Camelina sativa]